MTPEKIKKHDRYTNVIRLLKKLKEYLDLELADGDMEADEHNTLSGFNQMGVDKAQEKLKKLHD